MSGEKEKFRRELLLQEYLRLCTEVRSVESSNDRIVALLLAVLGVGATAGLSSRVVEVFFVIPWLAVGVGAFAGSNYMAIYSLAAYKDYLSVQLNKEAGEDILFWEAVVSAREKRNLLGKLLIAIYGAVALGLIGLSVYQIYQHYPLWIALGNGILAAGLVLGLAIGLSRLFRTDYRELLRGQVLRSR